MAYDKIIVIDRRLDHCLAYALNEEKTALSRALDYGMEPTKTRHLVTGVNCCPETACSEMQATKRRWDKRGGIQGYHIIHSYAPGEVTPEEAHEAGVEFARRLLGDRYEAVVSTHTDQEHLHCHIVFNSVSFMDGKKYRSDFQSYFGALRETSNAVSREYGLSVIEPEGGGKHYAEWKAEKTGRGTISGLVRQDIDAAIRESFTFESFLAALRRQGYTIKYGENVKHTAVTPPGGKRAFRLDSLGEGYTEADIRSRLAAVRSGEAPAQPDPPPMIPKRYRVRKGSIRRLEQIRGGKFDLASQAPPAHHDFRQGFRAGVNHGGIFFLHAQGRTAAADITRHRGNILHRNHGQGFDSHGPGGLFQGEFRINGNDEYVVLAGSPLRHQSLVHPFRRQSQGRRRVPGVHKFRTFIRIMPVRNMKRVQQPHGIGFDIPFLFPGHKS